MILVHQTFVPQSPKLYDERYSESSIPDLVTEVVKLLPPVRDFGLFLSRIPRIGRLLYWKGR